jgi:protein gp37
VRWNRKALAAWDAERGKGLPTSYPPRPTVFPSLCDWLDEEVPVELLARFLKLIHETPNLRWLLLTKRPELWAPRMAHACEFLSRDMRTNFDTFSKMVSWAKDGDAPANVWVGTSVEDQIRADQRIPALLKIPAVGRFLSVEPLLGPVILPVFPSGGMALGGVSIGRPGRAGGSIDWGIVGGESGPGARPCNVEWIRSVVRQCQAAGVPCFVKQLGSIPVQSWDSKWINPGAFRVRLKHPKGGDPAEWPDDLRVREFPKGLR